jgi:hypothetical protein
MKLLILVIVLLSGLVGATMAEDSSGVIQIDNQKVAETFGKGGMLLQTNNYKVMAGRRVAPGEIRAPKIAGGEEHHLKKGDVIVIPAGVPHQFTAVDGTFLYFVVKVTK